MSQQHAVIIGAGVTGLTSAVFLAEAGYRVTVVAAHVPGDASVEYTSPWAGAHWRTSATPKEPMQCHWDVQTYDYWLELLELERKDSSLPRSGLRMCDTFDYWDGAIPEKLWWSSYVNEFRHLKEKDDPIASINKRASRSRVGMYVKPIRTGVGYKACCINVPQYLLYLQDRAKRNGVKVIKHRLIATHGLLTALVEAEVIVQEHDRGEVDVFVNASGLGAAKLCNDRAMYPIRGQTVLVNGEANAVRGRRINGLGAYCIPRPGSGTTILGGTQLVGDWSEWPDQASTNWILEHNSWYCPELLNEAGNFEVISVQSGLRPGRKGGPRVEREVVAGKKVVHAYGHAGAGYQNSVGSARAVIKLVEESLAIRARL